MIWWAKKQKPQRQRARIPFFTRERAAYIKLRRIGLSINQIATAFGRSTSTVFRATKTAENHQTLRRFDLRKLPAAIRRRSASLRYQTLMKLISAWEQWIAGEGERPP